MDKYKRYFTPLNSYLTITIVFFGLIAFVPASKDVMHNYSISQHQYRILLFLVELPLAGIWFAAFYSYDRLSKYARSIKKTSEGQSFAKLAAGNKWLAFGYSIPTLVSLILNGLANSHPRLHTSAIVIVNYLSVLFPLIAFNLIASGTHHLSIHNKLRPALTNIRIMMSAFIVLGVCYCYLSFQHLDVSHPGSSLNPFYLPVWITLITLVAPYLFAWFIGLFAVQELADIARNTKGVLYRQALHLLSYGTAIVIAGSIGQQYVRSVIPRTGHLALNAVLVAIYLLYLVIVVGFVLMSIGANRLKKIEDI